MSTIGDVVESIPRAFVDPWEYGNRWADRMNQLVDMVLVNKEQRESAKKFIEQTNDELRNEAQRRTHKQFEEYTDRKPFVKTYGSKDYYEF